MRLRLPQPRSQKARRIRRERRRRLGRFVVFSEMLADLTPKPLIEPNATPKPEQRPKERMNVAR